jgi:hypothetical protein
MSGVRAVVGHFELANGTDVTWSMAGHLHASAVFQPKIDRLFEAAV